MMTDWRSSIGGIVGSGAVHVIGMVWILQALFGGPIREPGWHRGTLMRLSTVADPGPSFSLTPTLFDHDYIFKVPNKACGSARKNRGAALVGLAGFAEHRTMHRQPLVCIRVEPNGEVTSARVLVSSGNRAIDAAIERHARQLTFTATKPGDLGRAMTITLEIINARRPDSAALMRRDAGQPGILPM